MVVEHQEEIKAKMATILMMSKNLIMEVYEKFQDSQKCVFFPGKLVVYYLKSIWEEN
jgi:hypothetical protein